MLYELTASFRHVSSSLKKLVNGVKTNAQSVDIEEDDLEELASAPLQSHMFYAHTMKTGREGGRLRRALLLACGTGLQYSHSLHSCGEL